MRTLFLRWGAAKRHVAVFARVDTLIQHYLEDVKWRKENQRFKHNLTLNVRSKDPADVRLTSDEVSKLLAAGMLKKVEMKEAA